MVNPAFICQDALNSLILAWLLHQREPASEGRKAIFQMLNTKCEQILIESTENTGEQNPNIPYLYDTMNFIENSRIMSFQVSHVVPEDGQLNDLLKKFPLYNKEIEAKGWVDDVDLFDHYDLGCPRLKLAKIEELSLDNLCLPDTSNLNELDPTSVHCKATHSSPTLNNNCSNIQHLLKFSVYLNIFFRSSSRLAGLLPVLTLIGSIMEGTRIGSADELDINMTFEAFNMVSAIKGLSSPFFIDLSYDGITLLRGSGLGQLVMDGNYLDYLGF